MHIWILKRNNHCFLQVGYCFCIKQCKDSPRNPKVQKQGLMICLFVKFYICCVYDRFLCFSLKVACWGWKRWPHHSATLSIAAWFQILSECVASPHSCWFDLLVFYNSEGIVITVKECQNNALKNHSKLNTCNVEHCILILLEMLKNFAWLKFRKQKFKSVTWLCGLDLSIHNGRHM